MVPWLKLESRIVSTLTRATGWRITFKWWTLMNDGEAAASRLTPGRATRASPLHTHLDDTQKRSTNIYWTTPEPNLSSHTGWVTFCAASWWTAIVTVDKDMTLTTSYHILTLPLPTLCQVYTIYLVYLTAFMGHEVVKLNTGGTYVSDSFDIILGALVSEANH